MHYLIDAVGGILLGGAWRGLLDPVGSTQPAVWW
jgi:hypothetical protein